MLFVFCSALSCAFKCDFSPVCLLLLLSSPWALLITIPLHRVPTECLMSCQKLLLMDLISVEPLFLQKPCMAFTTIHTVFYAEFQGLELSDFKRMKEKKYDTAFLARNSDSFSYAQCMIINNQWNSCMPTPIFTQAVARIRAAFYCYAGLYIKFFSAEYLHYSRFFY